MTYSRLARVAAFALAFAVRAESATAQSQNPNERAVRAVVDSFFDAVAQEKWQSAATFTDLPRFESYFRGVVGRARAALPAPEPTVEEIMARDSTMPRAVAEYQLAQMKKYSGRSYGFGDMSYEFAGVHSQQELFALTPAAAMAKWLEAKDERTQMRESLQRMGCPLSVVAAIPGVKRRVLAIALAGDSLAYVIQIDDRFGSDAFYGGERVFPVHLTSAGWRIEARPDLLRPINSSFGFAECPKVKKP